MNKYLKKNFFHTFLLTLIIFSNSLLKIFSAYMIGSSFNYLLEKNVSTFIHYVSWALLSFLLFVLLSAFKIWYENYVTQKIIADIRHNIMTNIAKSEYEYFYQQDIGTYVSWLTNDLLIIEQKGFSAFFSLVTVIIETLLSIIALITFHWSIIIFTLITSALTLYLPRFADKKIQKSSENYSEALERSTADYTNYLNGFDTLLAYQKLPLLANVAHNVSSLIMKTSGLLKKDISFAMFLGGISNVLSQIGILILSGFLISINIINFGAIITIESLTGTIFNSLSNILDTIIDLNVAKPLFEKFKNYDSEITKLVDNNSLQTIDEIATLSFDNLSYAYTEKPILKDFTYNFEANKKYAFIGKSGSGKTTLLNILSMRLTNYDGKYLVNNLDIQAVNKKSMLKNIAYVSQQAYIFSDTLRFNLTLGDRIDDEEIVAILKKLELKELLTENGLDLLLEENGKNLSGGQKQRIALARALIRKKSILLLDEVTSSLDKENATLIENLILDKQDLTVILISHTLSEENKAKFDEIIEFPL